MFRYILTSILFIYSVNGANILAVIPTPSERCQKILRPIWQELSLRGHQVTLITTDVSRNSKFDNLTQIDVNDTYELCNERYGRSEVSIELEDNFVGSAMELHFSKESIKQLLQHKTKFDLVIVESFMPEYLAFADYYKCPSVLISADKTNNLIHSYMGNVPYHLKDSNYFEYSNLEILQRTVTLLFHYSHFLFTFMWSSRVRHQMLKKHFGPTIGSPGELYNNVDLLLMNFNPVFNDIVNLGPATATFAANVTLAPPKTLPKDLRNYLDSAVEGCIYFSLGTNTKSVHMQPDKIKIIMEALGELPYKVLWKFESDERMDLPKNIKLISWAPQHDILRHPNVKLFITQGGIQSLEEAIVSHVPMAMIPAFGDQEANAKRMELRGIAKIIPHKPLPNKEEFKRIVLEVINDPKYKENIIETAKLLLDQPMGGVEKAVWWIEYVIRHKGAKHLRNPALDVPFYQYYSLDVIALLIFVSYILFKILSFTLTVISQIFGYICKHIFILIRGRNWNKKNN